MHPERPKPGATHDIDPRLRQLAELAGILPEYQDNWGKPHHTSEAAYRALLGAMGIAAGDAASVEHSLRRLDSDAWSEILPPVHVWPVHRPIRTTLRLPAWSLGHEHAWRMTLEHGHTFGASFRPGELFQMEEGFAHGEPYTAARLDLPDLAETGYHHLEILRGGQALAAMPLIIHPEHCHQPESISWGRRVWGPSAQLYSLRGARDWGLGDYDDLRALVEWSGMNDGAIVGVSPLHALFPHNPAHRSPYSPSSRRFFNVLHIAVEAVPELAECAEARAAIATPAFQARLRALRGVELVDYPGVAQAKYPILEILYRHFRARHLSVTSEYAQEFQAYRGQAGDDLELFALYQALHEHFFLLDPGLWGWPVWPEAYRDRESAEVQAFAREQRERIEWFQWLQWQAERQIAAAGKRAFELGLGVGLYFDLAVGVDKGGAETWAHPELYAIEAKVGCPPDDFGPLGQDWGLPPWIPRRLRESAYAPFVALLRANMRHAGALRIDHVMSLMRLYWIPPGMRGDEGAYVAYPLRDLLGILALESQRNRCLVVGEDLGTVPGEVRAALHDLGVLSYRLFYFERDGAGDFLPPEHFPAQALVAAATHDLPPLAGFWLGRDIETRAALNLFPDEARKHAQMDARVQDRRRLLAMLAREGLLPEGLSEGAATGPDPAPPELIRAIYRHLARAVCQIALAQSEDMLGVAAQANVPGTVDEHPNWRRRLPLPIEAWSASREVAAFVSAMRAERPGG